METVEIKGLKELYRAMETLAEKLQKNVLRGATRAGSKVIAEEAKRLAPVAPPNEKNARLYGGRSGLLRDSIRVKSPQIKGGTVVVGGVSVGGKFKGTKRKGAGDAYYARWVELGTAAHVIKARKPNKMLAIGVAQVQHPGARKNPFLRPAMDSQAAAAVQAMREYIRKRLATKHGLDVPAPDDAE